LASAIILFPIAASFAFEIFAMFFAFVLKTSINQGHENTFTAMAIQNLGTDLVKLGQIGIDSYRIG